jgi:hypothetical protein
MLETLQALPHLLNHHVEDKRNHKFIIGNITLILNCLLLLKQRPTTLLDWGSLSLFCRCFFQHTTLTISRIQNLIRFSSVVWASSAIAVILLTSYNAYNNFSLQLFITRILANETCMSTLKMSLYCGWHKWVVLQDFLAYDAKNVGTSLRPCSREAGRVITFITLSINISPCNSFPTLALVGLLTLTLMDSEFYASSPIPIITMSTLSCELCSKLFEVEAVSDPLKKGILLSIEWSIGILRGCIQTFPDWVDNEIKAYNNKHSVEKQYKGLWRQNSLDWFIK